MAINMSNTKAVNIDAFPVSAGVVIPKLTFFANVITTGKVTPVVAADLALYNLLSIAYESFDNTLGADGVMDEAGGQRVVKGYTSRTIATLDFDAVAVDDIGKDCYAKNATQATMTAAGPKLGKIKKFFSATRAEVEFY